ncbi:MAG: hypothetical protein MJ183_02595 [Treponemataceae bacterium]|nr:hypothetical protein [Treponemataceae bacterium]
MSADKKPLLDLPLKVVLTEQGVSHFISRNKKLAKFRLADNVEESGVIMNKFAPLSLQRMILVDYVSKLEISMPEFVSSRQEIMDLSKLVVYSILYKQFDREIKAALLATDVVHKFNRANPSQLLDEKTNLSDTVIRSRMANKENAIKEATTEILKPLYEHIVNDSQLTPEEKNVYLLMTEKLLTKLSTFNWYIIIKFFKKDGFSEMLSTIRQTLQQYMEKSKIAEYISLMVMELALNCENANMRKEARIMYRGIEDSDLLIYDPDVRKKIIEELTQKGELVFISWKLGGGSLAIGKQGRLQITLYNKDDKFQEFKENVQNGKNADTGKKSLIDFYRDVPNGQEGTDLGLYYLSYLDEACKKVNVKFESLVNQFNSSDLTVINLIFNF